MADLTVKLPDVGEGIAEAELVEWHVAVGDMVREDDLLAAVMTDKATVEIPAPADGTVLWLGAEVGQRVPVGSALLRLGAATKAEAAESSPEQPQAREVPVPQAPGSQAKKDAAPAPEPVPSVPAGAVPASVRRTGQTAAEPASGRPLAAPSVRQRARDLGVDLRLVPGSGPGGRVLREDVERTATGALPASRRRQAAPASTEVKVVGLRRRIAEKMAHAHAHIVPITIVEEVDMTSLEALRATLNEKPVNGLRLTVLPFLMLALVRALAEHPGLNAHYDEDAGVIRRFAAVHVGIATQTPGGLVVPVVRHVEAMDLWGCARELDRLARRAREGTATREELTGSTITITSLGPLGAIATTPVVNHPEVAIVGVNRMAVRPAWDGAQFVPRKMMNLSSSFDHRIIDGWDAAVFVRALKDLLENPALVFMSPRT